MKAKAIFITYGDMGRLRRLIDETVAAHADDSRYMKYVRKLEAELDRAYRVDACEIPRDVVTMNSEVRLRDRCSGEEWRMRLVFPEDADFQQGRISILAPVGTAILGYRVGDVIEWEVPAGRRTFEILEVSYQPEAAGDCFPRSREDFCGTGTR